MASTGSLEILQKSLDLTARRHRVLAHNLANVSTPGYRRQDLNFEAAFREAVSQGPEAVEQFEPVVTIDDSAPVRADGNSVSLDQELAEMSKNSMAFQMAMQMLNTRLSIERMAISGRSM